MNQHVHNKDLGYSYNICPVAYSNVMHTDQPLVILESKSKVV